MFSIDYIHNYPSFFLCRRTSYVWAKSLEQPVQQSKREFPGSGSSGRSTRSLRLGSRIRPSFAGSIPRHPSQQSIQPSTVTCFASAPSQAAASHLQSGVPWLRLAHGGTGRARHDAGRSQRPQLRPVDRKQWRVPGIPSQPCLLAGRGRSQPVLIRDLKEELCGLTVE